MRTYLLRHVQVLIASVGQLSRTPGSTLMSVGVIGITLALPSLLYLLLVNAEKVGNAWHPGTHISLFLDLGVDAERAQSLLERLRRREETQQVRMISADRALQEFKELSGFGEALDALPHNPLPTLLVVTPERAFEHPDELQRLVSEFGALPGVELAQLDMEWVQRFHVTLRLARRAALVLSVLLALAVLLTVSNTIRLAILNRRDEIEIIQLFGGTDRFIQRPFLYSGMLQGFFGAGTAILLIVACLQVLRSPIRQLADLYGSVFQIAGLRVHEALALVAIGIGLGWLASRWSVRRHLHRMFPSAEPYSPTKAGTFAHISTLRHRVLKLRRSDKRRNR